MKPTDRSIPVGEKREPVTLVVSRPVELACGEFCGSLLELGYFCGLARA